MWNLFLFCLLLRSNFFVGGCDPTEMTRQLHTLTQNHPSIASLHSIGNSFLGQELWVMTLGDSVALRPILRPQVKMVGNINGYSAPSCFILIKLANELLEGYWVIGSEERSLLQSVELQILFDMNPDGYLKSTKGSCKDGKGRENGNNVNLNRNFPPIFPEEEEEEDVVLEPETEAVIGWMRNNNFVLSLSLGTGHTFVVIPFDDRITPIDYDNGQSNGEAHATPDHDVFVYLAEKYLKSVGHRPTWNCPNLNKSELKKGWVNGAAWYPSRGTMMDFSYILAATPELTIGLACCRNEEDGEKLQNIWLTHKKGLYQLLKEASGSMRGQVVDSLTQDVLEGVMLIRIDHSITLPAVPWLTSSQGEFWRLLPPGSYLIEVSKEGYKSARVEIVVEGGEDHQPTVVTIPLDPVGIKYSLYEPKEEEEETASTSVNISSTTEESKGGVPEEQEVMESFHTSLSRIMWGSSLGTRPLPLFLFPSFLILLQAFL